MAFRDFIPAMLACFIIRLDTRSWITVIAVCLGLIGLTAAKQQAISSNYHQLIPQDLLKNGDSASKHQIKPVIKENDTLVQSGEDAASIKDLVEDKLDLRKRNILLENMFATSLSHPKEDRCYYWICADFFKNLFRLWNLFDTEIPEEKHKSNQNEETFYSEYNSSSKKVVRTNSTSDMFSSLHRKRTRRKENQDVLYIFRRTSASSRRFRHKRELSSQAKSQDDDDDIVQNAVAENGTQETTTSAFTSLSHNHTEANNSDTNLGNKSQSNQTIESIHSTMIAPLLVPVRTLDIQGKDTIPLKNTSDIQETGSPSAPILATFTVIVKGRTASKCIGDVCNASRMPYGWSRDSTWALLSLSFLLIVLTIAILYTGLWKKRNTFLFPVDDHYYRDAHRIDLKDLIRIRLGRIPKARQKRKKRRNHNRHKYVELPLVNNHHSSDTDLSSEEGTY